MVEKFPQGHQQAAVENEPMVKSLGPKEAWQLLQSNPRAVLVDVRSSMEYLFVGHPVGAIHIPWMDEPEWTVNKNFMPHLRQLMLGGIVADCGDGGAPILLICRSGRRSHDAALCLLQAGFSEVYNVSEGFEGNLDDHHHRSTQGGWRFHGLPWEQC